MKEYIKPEVEIIASEVATLLAGSLPVNNDETYADETQPIYAPKFEGLTVDDCTEDE